MTGVALERNWTGTADDHILLMHDERLIRRKRLISALGTEFLVDLPEVTNLAHGDAFRLADGKYVEVHAAVEDLIEITGKHLHRLAWHIGNRHTPCQIEDARLLILRDHVLADMLTRLGATLRNVAEPFKPEGGAYGHGRTFAHSHGHDHER